VSPPERLVYTWSGGGVDARLIWTLRRVLEGAHPRLFQRRNAVVRLKKMRSERLA
jgi:hypothetical protein